MWHPYSEARIENVKDLVPKPRTGLKIRINTFLWREAPRIITPNTFVLLYSLLSDTSFSLGTNWTVQSAWEKIPSILPG